jgi:hypothetical protein
MLGGAPDNGHYRQQDQRRTAPHATDATPFPVPPEVSTQTLQPG